MVAWTAGSLRLLRRKARRGHTLKGLAIQLSAPVAEIDLALWALVGRTAREAAAHLNRRRVA